MDFSHTPVTLILIAVNVIFSIIGFSNDTFVSKAIMWPYGIKRKKQYGRFITSGFLHANWTHLFFNMFTFFFFGGQIERAFSSYGLGGAVSYLLLYFLALIVSDIPSYIKHQDDPSYRALGASGAVSAVVFAAVIFDPWRSLYIYGAIPLYSIVFAVLYIIYCIYMSKKSNDNVNHDAHLWGSLFGLTFTIIVMAIMQPGLLQIALDNLMHPPFLNR